MIDEKKLHEIRTSYRLGGIDDVDLRNGRFGDILDLARIGIWARDVGRPALEKYNSLLDSGFLVRNTDNDSDPDWLIKIMKPIADLKKAAEALKAYPGE